MTDEYKKLQLNLEWLPLGNIKAQNLKKPLTTLEVAQMLLQSLRALFKLHTTLDGFGSHGNIKPENIMVVSRQTCSSEFRIKMGDFQLPKGSSWQFHPDDDEFLAPEVTDANNVPRCADMVRPSPGSYFVFYHQLSRIETLTLWI